jgi:Cytochrome P460
MRLMTLALLLAIGAGPRRGVSIPPALADYRSWTQLTSGPKRVSLASSAMCLPAAGFRQQGGPHDDRWVMIYANPAALGAMRSNDAKEFPAGAVLAKEKRRQRDDKAPEAVAFMIKRGKGQFAKSGGWEFAFYPSSASNADYEHCVSCHRDGAAMDYVFSHVTAER